MDITRLSCSSVDGHLKISSTNIDGQPGFPAQILMDILRFSYTNEYLKISGSNIDGHPGCV